MGWGRPQNPHLGALWVPPLPPHHSWVLPPLPKSFLLLFISLNFTWKSRSAHGSGIRRIHPCFPVGMSGVPSTSHVSPIPKISTTAAPSLTLTPEGAPGTQRRGRGDPGPPPRGHRAPAWMCPRPLVWHGRCWQ